MLNTPASTMTLIKKIEYNSCPGYENLEFSDFKTLFFIVAILKTDINYT